MGSERILVEQLMNVLMGGILDQEQKLLTGQGYFSLISVDNGRVIMKEHWRHSADKEGSLLEKCILLTVDS